MSEKVTISREEYDDLKVTEAHMSELDARGVDNWGGYVGRYYYCDECAEDDISWAEIECPSCRVALPDDY